MNAKIRNIALDKLIPHPDNPNRMSRASFSKLMRHIKRTDRYEPLVVRPHPQQRGCFQIINGHHRCRALQKLSRQRAQAIVWDVDDEQTDILLATLNRLGGRDMLDHKLAILRRLTARHRPRELAKLLPQTKGQLERLTGRVLRAQTPPKGARAFAIPLIFFVNKDQQRTIEEALSQAPIAADTTTRAAQRAAALTSMATQSVNPSSRISS